MGLLAKTYRDVVPRFFPPQTTFSQLSLFPVRLASPRRSVNMSTCIAYRICFGILYEPWLPEPVPPATQVSPPGLVERSALVTPGPVGQSLNSANPPQGTRQLQRRPILREGGVGEKSSPNFGSSSWAKIWHGCVQMILVYPSLPNSTQWYICHITGMGLLAKTYRDVVPRFFPPQTTFSRGGKTLGLHLCKF